MSTQMATFTARMPRSNGGETLERALLIACETENDFGETTIQGPNPSALTGYVQFDVTIEQTVDGVVQIRTETVTCEGQKEDFEENPTLDGPVLVVQDPPMQKAA